MHEMPWNQRGKPVCIAKGKGKAYKADGSAALFMPVCRESAARRGKRTAPSAKAPVRFPTKNLFSTGTLTSLF